MQHLFSLFCGFLLCNALQAQPMHHYTYTLPLEQIVYGGETFFVFFYDTTGLSDAEVAIYEQIDDKIELISGDTSIVQMSYCDIEGVKTKKDNPITVAELPHIFYDAQYKTHYLQGYLSDTKSSVKSSLCLSTSFKLIDNKIECLLLVPDKRQLLSLNLQAGTTLNADEKWLILPHYEVLRRPTILKQQLKPIDIESAVLTTQQIQQLLKQAPPKWQQRARYSPVERLACYLHDKGFYNGPPILEKELRAAMIRFLKEIQAPDSSMLFLGPLMQEEGY